MSELRGEIYQTVATPLQFLWAPFELSIINMVFSVIFMVLSITIFNLTPFFSLFPLIIGHITLIVLGSRNPHIWSTIQSIGKYPLSRKNISSVSVGVKYVP